MATTGKINGDNFLIYVNAVAGDTSSGTAVAHSIDATLSMSQDLPDATTKDSAGYVDHINGNKSWEISGSGLVAFDTSMNAVELADYLMGGSNVYVMFSNGETGDQAYQGNVSVASVSISAPQNSATGFDFSLTGKGIITKIQIT